MIPRLTVLCALAAVLGCSDPGASDAARTQYNEGVGALAAGDPIAARSALLAARDDAGADSELRYRAAFNLGLTYATEAAGLEKSEPEQALEALGHAAAWFRDASSLRPEDDDARANLEVVLRRRQVLADQLNDGKALAARLARVIEDERALRDQLRALLSQLKAAGATAEPAAFASSFEALATQQRVLRGDAGTVWDLASAELGNLSAKPEQEQTEIDRARAIALERLTPYLEQARQAMETTRSQLRQLNVETAHDESDEALEKLKRAYEQLMDPVQLLRSLVGEEDQLARHTTLLSALRGGGLRLDDAAPPQEAPPWLTGERLASQQQRLEERTSELQARLAAGASAEPPEDAPPEQVRLIAAAAEAAPLVSQASSQMQAAATALNGGELDVAAKHETAAIEALLAAAERFADIRALIELAHADQQAVIALLTPPSQLELGDDAARVLTEMSTAERAELLTTKVRSNQDRMTKLEALFASEVEKLAAPTPADPAQPQAAQNPEQLEAERERLRLAEEHRVAASAALTTLAEILARSAKGALPPAQTAGEHLEELRRLWFSIVEHLEELRDRQAQTYDATSTAQASGGIDQRAELGAPADAQRQHLARATPLAAALEEQADRAAAASEEAARAQAEKLGQAAELVRSAEGEINVAAEVLGTAVDETVAESVELEPALEAQRNAMQHLDEAIALLKPPPQNQQDQQDQDQNQQQTQQDQDQNQQQKQQDQAQEVSQQQAERQLQAIRDREAARKRSEEQRQRAPREPVAKDW